MTTEAEPPRPELLLLQNLQTPSGVARAWSSVPHPSPRTPLLATASSDKSVHIWDMRDWKLLSTISGGHKRSVRCVSWKDYGSRAKAGQTDESAQNEKPVMLATGSFDANAGLWVWNKDPDHASNQETVEGGAMRVQSTDPDDAVEMDFTNQGTNEEDDDEDDWHFSTLLTGPDSEIKDLAFSPPYYSANLLATCSRDKSVWVWEEVEDDEWETIAVLAEHAGDVKCVNWCKGGRLRPRKPVVTNNIDETASEEGERIVGLREILASGSYDDTIRLWRDVEEEGDWMCVGVMEGHDGTVWDVKWEAYVNTSSYSDTVSDDEIALDWEPRIISCSDDTSLRVWKRAISESEREKKRERLRSQQNGEATTGMTTGFASTRLPSVIRPASSLERWAEEARLPEVHVRSVYAVDWSERTGLVVSCGGEGIIAVYQEIPADGAPPAGTHDGEDTVMTNGDPTASAQQQTHDAEDSLDLPRRKMTWKIVSIIEAAHEEYEINHVCWAPRRDRDKRVEDEEVIVSTGDDGEIKVWALPDDVLKVIA